MNEKTENKKLLVHEVESKIEIDFDGYPLYPISEDMYNKNQKEKNVNLDDISKKEIVKKKNSAEIEIIAGNDLDVPGAELDDKEEVIGSEDEENNYYSIGGDEHNDLDEDKGE